MTTVEAVEPLPFIDGIVYGEGPRWHNGRLWFSDYPAGKAYSVAVEVEVERPSGLGWLPDGTLVVSSLFAAKIYHVDEQANVAATLDVSHLAFMTNDLLVAIDRGWTVAPALGGADGRTLYMVIDDTTHNGLVKGESTGWISQARIDVPTVGSP